MITAFLWKMCTLNVKGNSGICQSVEVYCSCQSAECEYAEVEKIECA